MSMSPGQRDSFAHLDFGSAETRKRTFADAGYAAAESAGWGRRAETVSST